IGLAAPDSTLKSSCTSATYRAIGPMTEPSEYGPALAGHCPPPGTRPVPGFSPTTPQQCAGIRIEPARSLPNPVTEMHAAIAAASPPLDPPGVRERSCGLLVRPKTGLSAV